MATQEKRTFASASVARKARKMIQSAQNLQGITLNLAESDQKARNNTHRKGHLNPTSLRHMVQRTSMFITGSLNGSGSTGAANR